MYECIFKADSDFPPSISLSCVMHESYVIEHIFIWSLSSEEHVWSTVNKIVISIYMIIFTVFDVIIRGYGDTQTQ